MAVVRSTRQDRLERLRRQLGETRAEDDVDARRMRLNRSANLLVGVALRAASRNGDGPGLSDLERRLVESLARIAPDEEIADFGKVYAEMSRSTSQDVFPEQLTSLAPDASYGWEELMRDLPALGVDIAAQPNIRVIDVTEAGSEGVVDSEEHLAAMKEYGGGATLLTAPEQPDSEEARSGDPLWVRLEMYGFKCLKESGDGAFNTADEIYWTVGDGSDGGDKHDYISHEFGSVRTGTVKYWPSRHPMFVGKVHKNLIMNIGCWEADDSDGGFYNDLRAGLQDTADWCMDAATKADNAENEGGQAWIALVGLIAKFFDWLMGLLTNDDDLVKERTIGINRASLAYLIAFSRTQTYTFDGGGGGKHELWLRTSDELFRLRTLASGSSTWSPPMAMHHSYASPSVPALASYRGELHVAYADNVDLTLRHSSSPDGLIWGLADEVAADADPAWSPALFPLVRAHDEVLSCVFTKGLSGNLLSSYTLDGRWSDPKPVYSSHSTAMAFGPVLARSKGGPINVFWQMTGKQVYWSSSFDGSTWREPAVVPDTYSSSQVAAAGYKGKLYLVHQGHHNDDLWWASYDGTSWDTGNKLPGYMTDTRPALAVMDDKLYCVHRGLNGYLWWTSFDGSTWSPWTAGKMIPNSRTAGRPELAEFNGKLYLICRGDN